MDWIFFLVIAVALYVIVSLRVLKQYERGVVFLLGKFAGVRGPGLTLILLQHPKRNDDIESYRYDKKEDPVHGVLIICRARLLRSAVSSVSRNGRARTWRQSRRLARCRRSASVPHSDRVRPSGPRDAPLKGRRQNHLMRQDHAELITGGIRATRR